ncbi:XRE family transcriptional regulator [Hungatella hathewayi]|uniref:XRE family transcriptional regulator n=1 Tax=Hungatella hathewayi TaxID=154046 RepID=UPI0015F332C9|nr:LexA family transcriptional regulator [Hungatella hathewayi]
MSTLGERIRFAREQKGILQNELAKLIGIKSSAVISNWEKDINKPDAEKIVRLCDVLDVSVSFLLDYYGKTSFEFNSLEKKHIEKYRALDTFGRETVDIALDRETSRVQQISNALASRPAALRIYTFMHKIACAGNGFYFEDIPTDTLEAPYMEGADFIIGVSGDSMEPTYSDGDLVYVQQCQIINIGDIGIFSYNNECFIKEAGENGLISHNKRYPLIPGDETIRCIGLVLGKVFEEAPDNIDNTFELHSVHREFEKALQAENKKSTGKTG